MTNMTDLEQMVALAKEFAGLYVRTGLYGISASFKGEPEVQMGEDAFIEEFGKLPAVYRYGNRAYETDVDGVTVFALMEEDR